MQIDINKIEVRERLRSRLDPHKLRLLADDMERHGQLQEIVVAITWGTNSHSSTIVEKATLIAGYRRLEAAKLLGWTQIRCTRQIDGETDPDNDVDLLRMEYSENELRENFTEMERIAFGVKIKERIALLARARMLAGKKMDYEYDPETGYKIWNEDDEESESTHSSPPPNLEEGMAQITEYSGGEVAEYVANKVGMSKNKFRQGEYVLKHGTSEQHSAINCGEASISGTYNELRPTEKAKTEPQPKSEVSQREQPIIAKIPDLATKDTVLEKADTPEIESKAIPTAESPAQPVTKKSAAETKEARAMAMLSPKDREAVERNNAFAAMAPEDKVVELQSQLKTERCRAVTAEIEASRLKDELHNAIYHRDGIINSMQKQLDSANARISELEAKYEPNQHIAG